jgi:hypothetical protein
LYDVFDHVVDHCEISLFRFVEAQALELAEYGAAIAKFRAPQALALALDGENNGSGNVLQQDLSRRGCEIRLNEKGLDDYV